MRKRIIVLSLGLSLALGLGLGVGLTAFGKPFIVEADNTPVGSFTIRGNLQQLALPNQQAPGLKNPMA